MGVWIETFDIARAIEHEKVTPFVGVWIETLRLRFTTLASKVTPFVGVWIETILHATKANGKNSHTLRGCVD